MTLGTYFRFLSSLSSTSLSPRSLRLRFPGLRYPGLLVHLSSWLPLRGGKLWRHLILFSHRFFLLFNFNLIWWNFLRILYLLVRRCPLSLQCVEIFFTWLMLNQGRFLRWSFSFIDFFEFLLLLFRSYELHFSWRKLVDVWRRWGGQGGEVKIRRVWQDWRDWRLLDLLSNELTCDWTLKWRFTSETFVWHPGQTWIFWTTDWSRWSELTKTGTL